MIIKAFNSIQFKTLTFKNKFENISQDEVIPAAVRATAASHWFWATFSYVNPLHVRLLLECGLMCRGGAGSVGWKCLTAERGGVSQREHVVSSLDCHAVFFVVVFFPVWLQPRIWDRYSTDSILGENKDSLSMDSPEECSIFFDPIKEHLKYNGWYIQSSPYCKSI